MPYIKQERRGHLSAWPGYQPQDSGELNYIITTMLIGHWENTLTPNYQRINDIIGAIEGAKAEFQRRVVAPYEDIKILENGDLY